MGPVKYLLDTHTLLWAARGERKLGSNALFAIKNIEAQLFISAVSAYEIMFKHRLGKLQGFEDIAGDYFGVLKTLHATELPITARHAHFAGILNWSHRDPFDRLLAAQASTNDLTLLTNDPAFKTLPWVKVLW
jgi:PIN domain nuclease of toxin-antitoxin system